MELIERTAHMALLDASLAEARAGSGSVVLLGGDAGVGKTSLARAFVRRHAAYLRILWGSCEPLVTPEALGPFRDMAPLASILGREPSRFDCLQAMLDELRASPTTVMVVDDAHWADDATLDALRFLGRRVRSTPGMLLITYREDEAHRGSPLRAVLGDLATAPGCHRLGVAPLTLEAVTRLASGHPVEAGRLHAITGGNPFYVSEVLAARGWTVPPTVTDAVLARVSRLDGAARAVLEVVSVAPGGLEPGVAVEASGGDATALDACLDRGMLVMESERLTFRHELARFAVEESLPASRRQRLNADLLERLERLDIVDPSRLAHHADAAGDPAAVLRYTRLAAQRASQQGAHRSAAAHLGRAVEVAGTRAPAELADLLSAWADERMVFDDPREVIALRRRALELHRRAGNRRAEGREASELGRMLGRLGDQVAADRTQLEAIEILEGLPAGPELAKAYAFTAYAHMMAFRFDDALRRVAKALELAEPAGATAATVLALRVRATCQILQGRNRDALRSYEQARGLAVATGDHDSALAVIIDTGIDLLGVRRYPEATSRFEEAIELGRAIDLDARASFAEANLAQIHLDQGRWAEAEELVDRLLLEQQHHPDTRVTALAIRGRLAVRRGLPGAAAALDEAWGVTERGETATRWDIAAARAEAAWLSGRAAEIPLVIGDQYELARAEASQWPPSGWSAGELALWLWRAGALSGPPPGVAEPYALQMTGAWRAAATAWNAIGCPYEEAGALAEGDEPAMRQALRIFSRLGAEPAADRLRERMRRSGVANVPARPRTSTREAPGQLTRRQLEIVELLEIGLTNGEIAKRLFITEKTAGHHVSAILSKLGVRTRTEAALRARKMGITGPGT